MGKKNVTENVESLIRPRVRQLLAYHVEPFPCDAIMDANELPYPPPEPLYTRLKAAMESVKLNRYPDPSASKLKSAIAAKDGAEPSEILLGNGSDEIIQYMIASVCDPGDRILVPSPSFSMYKIIAHYLNVDTIEVPLNKDWSLDTGAMIDAIRRDKPKIVFIASPNNPTGALYPASDIERIIEAAEGIVLIDEAYIDFAEKPYGLLYRNNPNAVILRTISKCGFAAIRLGYILANAKLVEQFNKTRLPYNINSITQTVAAEAVAGWGELTPLFNKIVSERKRMFGELENIGGVEPFPSEANFIMMRVTTGAKSVFEKLISESVRVRWFEGNPVLCDCFRVTIGTPEENNRFLAALKASL